MNLVCLRALPDIYSNFWKCLIPHRAASIAVLLLSGLWTQSQHNGGEACESIYNPHIHQRPSSLEKAPHHPGYNPFPSQNLLTLNLNTKP